MGEKLDRERMMMEGEWERQNRRTAGQQNPPAQHDSPPTQNVSPQHVDPFGMQKGARPPDEEEAGAMQHCTIIIPFIIST